MAEMILSVEQVRIVSGELVAVHDKMAEFERLLVNAGTPGGDVGKSIQMVIAQRDIAKSDAAFLRVILDMVAATLDRAGVSMRNTEGERIQLLVDERDRYRTQLEDIE